MKRVHPITRAAAGRALLALSLLTGLPSLDAQEGPAPRPDAVRVGVGVFDVGSGPEDAAAVELLHRWAAPLFWNVSPQVGGLASSRGGVYGHAGLHTPLSLGAGFAVIPSFGVGAYSRGEGLDLGSVLEFRSGIEVGYRVADEGVGFSLFFYHLSNASLGRRNPGVEVLGLGLSFPR